MSNVTGKASLEKGGIRGKLHPLIHATTFGLTVFCCLSVIPVYAADKPAPLNVVTNAFKQNAMIPKPFTKDGADESPALAWSPVPKDTKSIAVFCEDPDAPSGVWCHWIAFNFSPKTQRLAQAIPRTAQLPGGAAQATNDFDNVGYNGPAPPKGKLHRYYFHVYALSKTLSLPTSAKQGEFRKAIAGAILAEGWVLGRYQR